ATSSAGTNYSAIQSFTTAALPQGLILYSIPAQRGTALRFSVTDIKPDHYAVVLFNSNGQQVYRKDMIIQTNFINDAIVIPGSISPGVYQFQLENVNGYRKRMTIMIK
ncbi:MAG: T9SS type A sorting domain-containing protein, partial [Chitinophagaceae bacterium]